MKKIYWFAGLIILIALLGIGSLYLAPAKKVRADDNVDLKIKLEASIDNGLTWHNYSGTTNPKGESITASPGDTVFIRLKTWNENATHTATNVQLLGAYTNTKYIASGSCTNTDQDGNGTEYSGGLATAGLGVGAIDLGANGSETANYESAIFIAKLKKSFPIGRTVIIGRITITDEGESAAVGQLLGAPYALASGLGNYSQVRVVVNVNENPQNLPQTGSPIK